MAIDEQTGGATGTAGSESAGTGAAAGTAGTQGSTGAASTGTGADATAKTSGFTYQEDRGRWLPPHRLSEETTKRTAAETRAIALEAELKAERARVQALAGVGPSDPNQVKADQVREAFFQMFPQFKHLANLTDEQMQALIQAPNLAGKAAEVEAREWARHGDAQLKSIYTSVADAIGAESLSADQQDDLRESFKSWLQAKAKGEIDSTGDSATVKRYEAGDPKLLQEFVKRFTDNFVEPARRKVTQQTVTRTRPVPNSQGRTQVTSSKRPEQFKTLDERLDYMAGELVKEGSLTRAR